MDYMKCVNSFSPDTSEFLFVFFLMLCFSVPSAREGHPYQKFVSAPVSLQSMDKMFGMMLMSPFNVQPENSCSVISNNASFLRQTDPQASLHEILVNGSLV